MIIENLKKEHISALSEIEKKCFSTPWSEENFLSEIDNPTSVFLVALDSGEPIGCISANNALGQGFISKVMVSPSFRRQGIGSALLCALCDYAEKNNFFELTLEVRSSNKAAIQLYKKFGFESLGIRKNFYRLPKEDAVIMSKYFGEKNEDFRN